MEGSPAKLEKPQFLLIQVLRGVAASMVVCHHATIMTRERLSTGNAVWLNGAAGVDIFFVISGFVMALSSRGLVGTPAPALTFVKRRLERVVPLYWLATTAKLVLLFAVPSLAVNAVGSLWNVVASYLFLPARNASGLILPVLIVGWTLNFEMMFYAVFAGALGLRVRPARLVVPVMVVLATLAAVAPTGNLAAFWYCNTIVLEFVFGMALYGWYERGLRLPLALGWVALVAGFAVFLLVPQGYGSWLRGWIWGLPAMSIVSGAVALEPSLARKAPAWLRELGDGSYSLYLAHGFALPLAGVLLLRLHVLGPAAFWPGVVVAVVASACAGELVYRGIERPIIRFFRQRRASAT